MKHKHRLRALKNRSLQFSVRAFISGMLVLLCPVNSSAGEKSHNGKKIDDKPAMINAAIIQFTENEVLTGQYPVTMSVSRDYLRIDDTLERKDYVLFSRKEKVIYSVNSEDQQIIAIKYHPVSRKPPIELSVKLEKLPADTHAPVIEGRKTEHYQLIVNDRMCEDIITVAGLLTDAVRAMKSFKQVLAGQQADTLQYLPADVHEACDLTKNTFYPTLSLDRGFPVMEISSDGYSRILNNFYQQDVDQHLFKLPENYEILYLN